MQKVTGFIVFVAAFIFVFPLLVRGSSITINFKDGKTVVYEQSEISSITFLEKTPRAFIDIFTGAKAFNGNNNGLTVGTELPPKIMGDFVIEMDVRPGESQQTHANIIDFNHRENIGLAIQQQENDLNNFAFFIGNGSSSAGITYRLQTGVWQHVVFQRQGKEIRLYVNGLLIQTQPCFAGNISYLSNSSVTVGYNANYGRYFKGEIKDLKISGSEDAVSSAGSAMEFTRAGQLLTIGFPEADPFTEGATLSAWVYFDKLPSETGRRMHVVGKPGSGSDLDLLADPDDRFHFFVATGGPYQVVSTMKIQPRKWYFVAVTYLAQSQIMIYVDGKKDNAVNINGVRRNGNPSPLCIGESVVWPNRTIIGKIDEVSAWTRALSNDEIERLMKSGPDRDAKGLSAYVSFEESIRDFSSANRAIVMKGDPRIVSPGAPY